MMVPDKFNMVDMGGIDLIMMQGEEVPGLYNRLVESIAQCSYQCLYNWLFDGVIIPPSYVKMEVGDNEEVVINEGVTVTSDDVIHIYSLGPSPVDPQIIPLLVEENGVYNVPSGKDGFNPVTVDVPSYTPVINPISITENGVYNAPEGVDGYAPVTVNVPSTIEHYIYNKIESKPIIDTGIPCNTSGLKVSLLVAFGGQNDRAVFGGAWATNGFFLSFLNSGLRFHSKGSSVDIPSSEVLGAFAGKNTIECTADSIVVNGNTYSISGASANTSNTLKIFTPDSSHTAETQAIYSMKIYQGDTLLRDFVPASNNGIACFLDNVSGDYFYNTGEANSLFYL